MDEQYHHSGEEDDDDGDLARQLSNHNNHQSDLRAGGSQNFSHSQYQAIDPSLENEGLSSGSPDDLDIPPNTSSNLPPQRNSVVNPQQFSRQFVTDTGRNGLFSSTPTDPSSIISARFPAAPQSSSSKYFSAFSPTDRTLPSRDVTDDTIDDAYVEFILYCNPSVDLSTDTTELRRSFRAPPKSDGKNFSTYTLLELIRQLENKELKTWTQLAINLGVEPPVIGKNQSTQKVQQYAVRLKRWMHAMHVDAFFEFCLRKSHPYYTQIPSPAAPYPEHGRDGVPMEEDLALRALHPESRPKRGRRKTEDKDDGDKALSPVAKRLHLDTTTTPDVDSFSSAHSALFPHSGLPSSSQNDDMDSYVENLDSWTAASAITPSSVVTTTAGVANSAHPATANTPVQHFRWRLSGREVTPSTPHPQSAITPRTATPDFDEPQSAITPSSKSRSRRRHGPAVSSAWPSSGNPVTGKLRGRPPSNRSVRDGPFSTFPANPKTKEGPTIDLQGSSTVSTPISGLNETSEHSQFNFPLGNVKSPLRAQSLGGKPSNLHLQVPQRLGGPVRLATPTVLVNGESETRPFPLPSNSSPLAAGTNSSPTRQASHRRMRSSSTDIIPTSPSRETASPKLGSKLPTTPALGSVQPLDVVQAERSLTIKLLQADMLESSPHLSIDEAKELAAHILQSFPIRSNGKASPDAVVLKAALCLGIRTEESDQALFECSSLRIRRNKEASNTKEGKANVVAKARQPEVIDIEWTILQGKLTAEFKLAGLSLDGDSRKLSERPANNDREVDNLIEPSSVNGNTNWKAEYLELQKQVKLKDEAAAALQARVLSAIL